MAEFRADFTMLAIAIALSFTGFIFAAPGAVLISGQLRRDQNGKISLAGPLSNMIIAIIFLALGFFFSPMENIARFGFTINSWLAFFNLFPFQNFDGKKVYQWNKTIYFILLVISVVMVFVYFAIIAQKMV